ncbi:MAG: hypothetical protein KF782_13825 [Labilithrix sp.]|nr:hypothetical protein [Labilithrix sp.]
MKNETCPRCQGPAVRLTQTGELSCARQCNETPVARQQRLELHRLTAELARAVAGAMPKGVVFALVVAEAPRGSMAYVSTADRGSMRHLLRELLDKMETEQPS